MIKNSWIVFFSVLLLDLYIFMFMSDILVHKEEDETQRCVCAVDSAIIHNSLHLLESVMCHLIMTHHFATALLNRFALFQFVTLIGLII